MIRFKNYVKAGSLEEAYTLNQKKSSAIGGGMMWMKMQKRMRMTLVDLVGLGLDGIDETEEEFSIGAMCSLRQLEIHEGLNEYFGGIFKECTRSIVGIQFRNGATVGGSVFGRFGFSDIITCLLALDTYVELYQGGLVSLEEFCRMKQDRDILVRIRIKKDGRQAAYASQRIAKTDFPQIACCVAKKEDQVYVSIGARPGLAEVVALKKTEDSDLEELAKRASDSFRYGTNMRGSADYRKHLAEVYTRRLLAGLHKEEK